MTWEVQALLDEVKLSAMLPDINGTISDDDICLCATHAMRDDVTPLILQARREYWLKTEDQSVVSGTALYRIPKRAIGQKLRDVRWIDASSNEYSLPEVPYDQSWLFRTSASTSWGAPYAYCFEGDQIRLLPTPTSSVGTIRMAIYLRRAEWLSNTGSATYTIISSSAGQVLTVATDPADVGISTSVKIDIVRADEPHDYVAYSVTPTATTTTSITLPASATGWSDGDYVFLEDTTSLFSAPADFRAFFVNATVARVLVAIGDPKVDQALAILDRDKERLRGFMEPRNDGETQRVINRTSPLRTGRRGY